MSETLLPYNEEAEQVLLGSLLYNNTLFKSISEFLKADHFVNTHHQEIYTAIERYYDRDQIADPITLKSYFKDHPNSKVITDYLIELASNATQIIDVGEYGKIIYDLYLRRELIDLGTSVVIEAKKTNTEKSTDDQISDIEGKLLFISMQRPIKNSTIKFRSALTQSLQTAKKAFISDRKIVGITSGLKDLDEYLGGFHNSDLIILAGRPSMGKTALATTIAFNAAQAHMAKQSEGCGVLFFSLEMSAEQLATRLLASESNLPSDKIRRGEINNSNFERFIEVSRKLENLDLYIDDTPSLTIPNLRSIARTNKKNHNIGLIIIDYLQLLTTGRPSSENRVNDISEISRSLKSIAKELNTPIIALSQLSRALESREDKKPFLSDLRESGSIEQDADVVMFVYREEYYLSRKQPDEGDIVKYNAWRDRFNMVADTADIIIGKQRHGPIGTVKLKFDGRFTKFSDLPKV